MGKTKQTIDRFTGIGAEEANTFFDHLRRKNYTLSSRTHYRCGIKDFLFYLAAHGFERLQDITEEDLDAYRLHLVDRNLKPRSMDGYLCCVRLWFRHLEQTGQLFINPARHLVLPRVKRDLQPVPDEKEIKTLLAQPDLSKPSGIRDRAFLETAYSTGMRLFELMSLSIFDPDLERGTLRIMGKGRKERVVPLGQTAIFWLKKYLRHARPGMQTVHPDDTAVWLARGGAPLSKVRIQQMIRHYAIAAKIRTPITAHGLRRACATHMLSNGAHPVQIQMLLGHSSLKSLGQYLDVSISELKATHGNSLPGK